MARIDYPVYLVPFGGTFVNRKVRTIPVSAATPYIPLSTAIIPDVFSVTLNFNIDIDVSAPASDKNAWKIVNSSGELLGINSITIGNDSIVLNTDEHTGGENYTLIIPSGIESVILPVAALVGPYAQNYTGTGVSPTVLNAMALTYNTVRVTFSEPVIEAEALINTNYLIDNGAFVTRVTKVTDSIYDLSTSPLNSGVSYTVTASNIHDLAHNPI